MLFLLTWAAGCGSAVSPQDPANSTPLAATKATAMRALEAYMRYYRACDEGDGVAPFPQRVRTPEATAKLVPLLDEAIAAERAAIEAVKRAAK